MWRESGKLERASRESWKGRVGKVCRESGKLERASRESWKGRVGKAGKDEWGKSRNAKELPKSGEELPRTAEEQARSAEEQARSGPGARPGSAQPEEPARRAEPSGAARAAARSSREPAGAVREPLGAFGSRARIQPGKREAALVRSFRELSPLVVLTDDCSMAIALSPRGGPGEFMRTVGGMPAIAAGWEKAYRHNTVR